jgi:hypothetical protein
MAEVNGRIDGWWKILHLDDSTMTREELRSPNPWLSRAAPRSFRDNYALDTAFVLIDGAKLVSQEQFGFGGGWAVLDTNPVTPTLCGHSSGLRLDDQLVADCR